MTEGDNGSALAVIDKNPLAQGETSPAYMQDRARQVAAACKQIVLACATSIKGRRHIRIEGWQALANTYGCVGTAGSVEKVDGGWRALGTVIHLASGREIAHGEGFVGEDESMWMSRPLFARRAMAQTRAISRACRAAFAFIVPMIDAGLSTTPAEEMTHVGGDDDDPAPRAAREAYDMATGEVIDAPPSGSIGEADLKAAEARVNGAATAKEALDIVNASPSHIKRRLVQTYRERWAAK